MAEFFQHPEGRTGLPINFSRACRVSLATVRVQLGPFLPVAVGRGGLVRRLRAWTLPLAPVLALFFTVHCTRPPVSAPGAGTVAGAPSADALAYHEEGESSWYGGDGDGFAGRPTASGEIFDPSAYTCAHRTLPLGTYLEVENTANGRTVVVKVNDRGPFARGRMLDLSRQAAKDLGFLNQGTARVRIRSVDAEGRPAPVDPNADRTDPYTVQVAALSNPENVARLSADLARFGPVTTRDALTRGGLAVKRVRVGAYTRLQDAQKALDQITQAFAKDRGVEPFITRQR